MKAADLRKSILQAAVQGKLVPQNPHDEPAAKLLERIKKEKARLIKEGKIKKEKPLPPISEEEISFDLPEGWVWCRLNDLCEYVQRGKSPTYSDEKRIPVLSQKCVQWSGVTLEKAKFIAPCSIENYDKERFIKHNDLLWNSTGHGTLGRIGIVDTFKEKFNIIVADSHVTVVRCLHQFMLAKYILILFSSPHVQSEIVSKSNGSTNQIELATSTIKEYIVPFPPLPEQQRIVAKVNELLVLCDELEAAEKELDILEYQFTQYLPKSILQAAVQGKLVPQNIHEESADKLLERIKIEKAKLVRSGKLKKEKPLPPITEDEVPYDLPDGWVWCRLGDMIEKNTGGGTPSKQRSDYWGGDIPWASVKDMNVEYISKTEDHITIKGLENSSSNLVEEDSIIVCTRMGLGKIAVNRIPLAINQDLRALRLSALIDKQYFILAYKTFAIAGSGMTVKGIKIDELHSFLFPLPPLAEQQRIVAKVNELMSLCDALKAAHDAPVGAPIAATVIPFPHQEEEPEMLMAARGVMPKAPSKALQDARNRLFED